MLRTRVTLAAILVAAVVLGVWSLTAIRRTANRRGTLVDRLMTHVPLVPGARMLAPWQPVADADLAHLTLCIDGSDVAAAAALFAASLPIKTWRVSDVHREGGVPERASVTASDETYRLRAVAEAGTRTNCDGARGEVLVSVEAAPATGRR